MRRRRVSIGYARLREDFLFDTASTKYCTYVVTTRKGHTAMVIHGAGGRGGEGVGAICDSRPPEHA